MPILQLMTPIQLNLWVYLKPLCLERLYVMPGKHGCLLSVGANQTLNLINVNSQQQVNQVKLWQVDRLLREHPDLSKNVGLMKDFKVKLYIDKSVTPVAQWHRRILFHLRSKVEKELKCLKDLKIIEQVQGLTLWVLPIIVAPKPRNLNEICICVDMREVNWEII